MAVDRWVDFQGSQSCPAEVAPALWRVAFEEQHGDCCGFGTDGELWVVEVGLETRPCGRVAVIFSEAFAFCGSSEVFVSFSSLLL